MPSRAARPQNFRRTDDGTWLATGKTLTEALDNCAYGMLREKNPDVHLSIETNFFHTLIVADSIEYSFNVGRMLGFSEMRWTKLIREYVNAEHLERFIQNARETLDSQNRLGASDGMFFKDPPRYAKKHRWGGCLTSAVFIGNPEKGSRHKGTLIFHSRTTYIGFIGFLDAAIAYCLAWYITDGRPEDISFRWRIDSAQYTGFKTIPWMLKDPKLDRLLEQRSRRELEEKNYRKTFTPAWDNAIYWHSKTLLHWDRYDRDPVAFLENEKYGSLRRMKKCWLIHNGLIEDPGYSWEIEDLTFDKVIYQK